MNKNPLLVLLISAMATFTMGWVAHRVFSKSYPSGKEPSKNEQQFVTQTVIKAPDSPFLIPVFQPAVVDTPKTAVEKDTILKPQTDTSIQIKVTVTDVEQEDSLVRKKFVPKVSFGDYAVSKKYKGPIPQTLDFSTCGSGKLYQKATKAEVKGGPDFAGQYAFAQVSCGTDCYSSTIVDLKTGKVYAGPKSSNGYQFKINSSLLIVNPPDSKGYYPDCEICAPELYVWTGKKFKKISY